MPQVQKLLKVHETSQPNSRILVKASNDTSQTADQARAMIRVQTSCSPSSLLIDPCIHIPVGLIRLIHRVDPWETPLNEGSDFSPELQQARWKTDFHRSKRVLESCQERQWKRQRVNSYSIHHPEIWLHCEVYSECRALYASAFRVILSNPPVPCFLIALLKYFLIQCLFVSCNGADVEIEFRPELFFPGKALSVPRNPTATCASIHHIFPTVLGSAPDYVVGLRASHYLLRLLNTWYCQTCTLQSFRRSDHKVRFDVTCSFYFVEPGISSSSLSRGSRKS